MMQEAKVDLLVGRYDQAIQLLKTHHFHNWEGYGEIHDVYADALALRGEAEVKAGKYQAALKDYEASLEYPENLEVGRPYHETRLPQVNYLMGLTYEKLGNTAKSHELFQQALSSEWRRRRREQPEMLYYQGMAALKLGQNAEANQIFDELIAMGNQALAAGSDIDYFAKFGLKRTGNFRLADAHYLIGLGSLGKGETAKAREEFRSVLGLNVNHLGATTQLASAAGAESVASR
jgi:tetratricopeptide (TPR) repeat protein